MALKTLFGLQIAYTKCIGSDRTKFGWKMGCTTWDNLSSQQLMSRFWPDFFRGRERFETIRSKKMSTLKLAWAEKNYLYQNREVQILPILVFRALPLKIQTAITLSILEIRGSPLDSREL